VLAGLHFTIDYLRRRLLLHTGAVDPPGTRLPLELNGGRALVLLLPPPGQAPVGPPNTCQALKLVPDSGADGLVLFDRPGGALPPVTPLDTSTLRTLSGLKVVRRVLIDELAVGAIRLRRQIGVLVERTQHEQPMGDGLLPLHLFARVTFNGPEGYLIVATR
jgi:hypothetical protein